MLNRIRPIAALGCLCICTIFTAAFAGEEAPAKAAADVKVPLHEGLGSAHIPITTSSELAQTYFDQGLRLHYGFWISESPPLVRRSHSPRSRRADAVLGEGMGFRRLPQ